MELDVEDHNYQCLWLDLRHDTKRENKLCYRIAMQYEDELFQLALRSGKLMNNLYHVLQFKIQSKIRTVKNIRMPQEASTT